MRSLCVFLVAGAIGCGDLSGVPSGDPSEEVGPEEFGEEYRAVVTKGGGDYYAIASLGSGRCLDVVNGSTAYGAQVQQYMCNSTSAQSFKFECKNEPCTQVWIRPEHSNHCLRGESTGLRQRACSSTDDEELWTLETVFSTSPSNTRHVLRIRSAGTGDTDKCMDVPSTSEHNSVLVQWYSCNDGANQRWLLIPRYYTPSGNGFGGPEY